jgi:hypothetical protein
LISWFPNRHSAAILCRRFKTGTPEYNHDTNPSTRVIVTFTPSNWETDEDGWNVIHYQVIIKDDTYFRLRGTNVPLNKPGKTDASGNPLLDPVPNSEEAVWRDLWFYSNQIFVKVINK